MSQDMNDINIKVLANGYIASQFAPHKAIENSNVRCFSGIDDLLEWLKKNLSTPVDFENLEA